MKITDAVRQLLTRPVEELGYELYDIDYLKEAEGYVLTLYIDAPQGITLDDCEKVSRAVDPLLDERDIIPQAYFLSVSSVGLDRPLKLDKDFARSIGKDIDIKLYAPVNGKKTMTGTLEEYDADTIMVSGVQIARKSIALARLHIDF